MYGDRAVKVVLKTGNYAREQRWALFKTNPTGVASYLTDKCPGEIDGGGPEDWNQRVDDKYMYGCMRLAGTKNIRYGVKKISSGELRTCLCGTGCSELPSSGSTTSMSTGDCHKIPSAIRKLVSWNGLPTGTINCRSDYNYGENDEKGCRGSSYGYQENNKDMTLSLELEAGAEYVFKAVDTYGDGWNGGTYAVVQKSNESNYLVPTTKFDTGYFDSTKKFTMPPSIPCPAGYYCPSAIQKIPCGNVTVYCPEGSFGPTQVPAGHCGTNPAIRNDYRYATAHAPCSNITASTSDGTTLFSKELAQPASLSVKIQLVNSGKSSVSWVCKPRGSDLKLKHKTTGLPAWELSVIPCFSKEIAFGNNDPEWLSWPEHSGHIPPKSECSTANPNCNVFELEVKMSSSVVERNTSDTDGATNYKAKLKISYVSPSESRLQPTIEFATFEFEMGVKQAQSILVFPFEIEKTMRVGESLDNSVYVFNIGTGTSKFGVFLDYENRAWLSADESTYCNRSNYTGDNAALQSNIIAANTNSAPAHCVAINDRSIKEYKIRFDVSQTVASKINPATGYAIPYESKMTLQTTLNEEIEISLLLTVTPGVTKVEKSEVHLNGIRWANTPGVTAKTALDIAIHAKDEMGGATNNDDFFTIEIQKMTYLNSTFEENDCPLDGSLENDCPTYSYSAKPKTSAPSIYGLETAFSPSAYGNYTVSIKLSGKHIDSSPYSFRAGSPSCSSSLGLEINDMKDACLCQPGYGSPQTELTEMASLTCLPCTPGKHNPGANLDCKNCVVGKYNGNYTQSKCKDCKNGKYSDEEGLTICKTCADGSSSNDDNSGCDPCAAGKYAAGACKNCPVGRYQPLAGQTKCDDCTGTRYSDTPGTKECTTCPPGLIVKGKLGTSKDSCVCKKQAFFYPKVTATISFQADKDLTFSDDTRRRDFLVLVGSFLNGYTREYGLRSGIKLLPHEAITIVFAETVGTTVTTNLEIMPASSSSADLQKLFNRLNDDKDDFKEAMGAKTVKIGDGTRTIGKPFEEPKIDILSTTDDCEACPAGGTCPVGTNGEENIVALPGQWRPYPEIARFFKCNIPTEQDGKFWLWANCMGGKLPVCAPVFDYNENRQILNYFNNASFKYTADSGVFDFSSDIKNCNQTANCDSYSMAMLDFFQTVQSEGDFQRQNDSSKITRFGAWKKANQNKYTVLKKMKLIGFYSGPLCSTCPVGSGRDGDAKSSLYCAPCPAKGSNTMILAAMGLAIFLSCAALVLSQISKGSHERQMSMEHQDILHSMNSQNNLKGSIHEGAVRDIDTLEHLEKQKEKHGTKSGSKLAHKQIITGMFRIMLSYCQVTALARSVPIQWPESVVRVLEIFEIVTSPSLNNKSVDCAFQNDGSSNEGGYYKKFEMMMVMPVFIIVIPGIIWFLYWIFGAMFFACGCKVCSSQNAAALKYAQDSGVGGKTVARMKTAYQYTQWHHRNRAMKRWLISILVVAFMLYATISKDILKMFACQRFGKKNYLIADYSIDCDTDNHASYKASAVFFFIIYSLGFPLLGYVALRPLIDGIHFKRDKPVSATNPVPLGKGACHKTKGVAYTEDQRGMLMDKKLTAHALFGFLWQGLEERGFAPYWEILVVTPRKLMMVIIIINMQDVDPNYQMVTAVIILMFFMVFHVKVQPYDASIHNNLELASLMVSQLTLFLGLITNFVTTNEKGSDRTMTEQDLQNTLGLISYAIILINMFFMGYFFMAFGYHMYFVLPRPCQKLFDCLCCVCQRCAKKKVAKKFLSTMNHEQHEEDAIKERYVKRRNSGGSPTREMQETATGKYHKQGNSKVHTHMKITLPAGIRPGQIIRVKSPWDPNVSVNVKVPYNAKAGMRMVVQLPESRTGAPPAPQTPTPNRMLSSPNSSDSEDDYSDSNSDDDSDSHVVI